MNNRWQLKKWRNSAKIYGGVMLLVCGCAIYLLFRSKTLSIYVWCRDLGCSFLVDCLRLSVQNWNIPAFIKFSLPDGLYSAAYLLIIDAIWHNDKRPMKYILLSIIPVITIGNELLQYLGLIRGTFDYVDLICYMVPPLLFFSTNSVKTIYFNNKLKPKKS